MKDYKVISEQTANIERLMNRYARDGYEFKSIRTSGGYSTVVMEKNVVEALSV